MPPWSWSNNSWIYNYLYNQCLSQQICEFEPHSWQGVLDTTLYDKDCQWLATGLWFTPVSSTNKTDHHDITGILLKAALNSISLRPSSPQAIGWFGEQVSYKSDITKTYTWRTYCEGFFTYNNQRTCAIKSYSSYLIFLHTKI